MEATAGVPSGSVPARCSWPLWHSAAALDAISVLYGQLEMWAQGAPPTSDELVSRAAAVAAFVSSIRQPSDDHCDATASLSRFLAEGGATALSCALDYTVFHLSEDPAIRLMQQSVCSKIAIVLGTAAGVAPIRGALPSLVALWRADQATATLAVNSVAMILLRGIESAVLRRLGIFELAEATLRADDCPAFLQEAVVRLLRSSVLQRVGGPESAARVTIPISLLEPVLQARHNVEAMPSASCVLQHWLQRDDSRDACLAAILASDAPTLLSEAVQRCGSVDTATSYCNVLAAVVATPESATSSPPLSLVLLHELPGLLRAHAFDGSTAAVGRLAAATLLAAPAVPASSEGFPARFAALLDVGTALTAALTAAAAAGTLDSGVLAPLLEGLQLLGRHGSDMGASLVAVPGLTRALGKVLARTRGDDACVSWQEDAVAALARCLQRCVCEGGGPDTHAVAAAALTEFEAEGGFAALAELVKNHWESPTVAAHVALIFTAAFLEAEDRVKAAAAATPWEFGLISALNFHESDFMRLVACALRVGFAHSSPEQRRKLIAEVVPNLGRLVTAHLHNKDALRELVGLCNEFSASATGKASLVQHPCTLLGALLSAWEAEETNEDTVSILMGALAPLSSTSEGRAALVAPAARDLVIRALHRYAARSEPSARRDVFNMLGLVFELVRDKGACAAAVGADAVSALMATLVARPEDSGVLRRVAGCLSDMARDPAGQVAILTCTEGLGVLVAGLLRACGEQAVAINCSILCYSGIETDAAGVGAAFRSALVAAGVGRAMVAALAAHAVSGKMETVRPVARALAALAKDQACRQDMLSHDLAAHVAAALTAHSSEVAVVAQLAALVAQLSREPAARNAFVSNGTLVSLLRLMRHRGQTDKELAVRLLPALVGLLPGEGAPAAFAAADAGSTLLHFAQSLTPADRSEAVFYGFQLLSQLARLDERVRAAQAASPSFVGTLLLLLRTRDGPELEFLLHAVATLSRERAGRVMLLERSGVEAVTAVLQKRIANLGAAGAGCYTLRRLADPTPSAAPAIADGGSSSAAVTDAALAAAFAVVPAAAWARAAELLLAVMQQHDGSAALVTDAARTLCCLLKPSLPPAGAVAAAVKAALRAKDGVTALQVLQATHADSEPAAAAALGRVCVLLLQD